MKLLWLTTLCAVIVLTLSSPARNATSGAVRYELLHETKWVSGVRMMPYTTYRYVQIYSNGTSRILWTERRMEDFAKHWISDSGVVWILTKPFPGPSGAGKIWSADDQGLHGNDMSVRLPGSRSRRSAVVDTTGTTTNVIRIGQAESFHLRLGSDIEYHALLVRRNPAGKYQTFESFISSDNPKWLFEEVIEDARFEIPQIYPVNHSLKYWIATNTKGGEDRVVLFSSQYHSVINESVIEVSRERVLPAEPVAFKENTYFMFDELGAETGAWIETMDFEGNVKYRGDLLKLGDYSSASDAKRKLKVDSFDWYFKDNAGEDDSSEQRHIADFWDTAGKRFEFTLLLSDYRPVSGNIVVQSGVFARRPVVTDRGDSPVETERFIRSPNGIFEARHRSRMTDYDSTPERYNDILISVIVNENGEKKRIQLYNEVKYGEVDIRLSDSGMLYLLCYSRPFSVNDNKVVDSATFRVLRPDGNQAYALGFIGEHDSRHEVQKYTSIADVRARVAFDQLRIELRGERRTQSVMGVQLPQWEIEEFWLPEGDDSPIHSGFVNGKQVHSVLKNGRFVPAIPE